VACSGPKLCTMSARIATEADGVRSGSTKIGGGLMVLVTSGVVRARARRVVTATMASSLVVGVLAVRVGASPPYGGPLPSCSVACISVGDLTMLEGDSGQRTMQFAVTLSRPATTQVTVQYRLAGGSATGAGKLGAGVDYNNKNGAVGTLTFAVGPNGTTPVARPVSVLVYGDTAVEGDETFRVILSNPTGGARLARPLAIGTIIDDDSGGAGIHVGVGDASIVEGNVGTGRNLAFAITLSSPATSAVSLSYAVVGVDAVWGKTGTVVGADFGGSTSGTLNFAVGGTGKTAVIKKIVTPVWPGSSLESDETLTVTVSATSLPSGVSITRPTGTGTIIDDDAAPTSEPVPTEMAALGDSITRAFDACPQFGECPAASWATGTDPLVDSQYSRILAANPAILGHAHNDAVSGATMADLAGQASTAVGQNADYVTIEMGGNDACKATEADMTPVATYQSQFQTAMTTLENGLPNVRIFVASVPDIKRLWFVAKDNPNARNIWATFGICQSMTANPLSTDQADVDRRDRVRQRVIDYNTALATVCAQYANCRFDGNVVFDTPFELSDVSSIDYFHPSFTGQTGFAILTYAAGWNW
jgi:lysophospholipase L1-like esterase